MPKVHRRDASAGDPRCVGARHPCAVLMCVHHQPLSAACTCGAGTGAVKALLMASYLGKWGLQKGTVALPAVATGEVESVDLTVWCYVRKVVW